MNLRSFHPTIPPRLVATLLAMLGLNAGIIPNSDAANCPPIAFGPVPVPTMAVPQESFSLPNMTLVADLNRDRHPDIIYGTGTAVYTLFGNGNGGFASASNSVAGAGTSLALTDLNHDTFPDLIIGTATRSVRVALGNGDGTFKAPVLYAASASTTPQAQFVAAADFDGDGHPDIAAVLVSGGGVGILPGRGDGTFGTPRSATVATPGSGLIAADFNHDGFIDLLTTTTNATRIAVLLNQGDGTFRPPTNSAVNVTGVTLTGPRVGDLNGDGIPDLAILSTAATKRFFALLGNGNGTFTPSDVKTITATAVYNLTLADVTGDGRLDVILASYTSFTVLENLGNGTFADPLVFPLTSAGAVVSADFNQDERPDVAVFGGDAKLRINLNETEFLPAIPQLAWRLTTGLPRLVWNISYSDYALEFSPRVGPDAAWQAAAGSPSIVNCLYFYDVGTNTPGFYRLRKP